MATAYFVTVELRTRKPLGTEQQDKLREAVLAALDDVKLPYVNDVVTANIGGEESA